MVASKAKVLLDCRIMWDVYNSPLVSKACTKVSPHHYNVDFRAKLMTKWIHCWNPSKPCQVKVNVGDPYHVSTILLIRQCTSTIHMRFSLTFFFFSMYMLGFVEMISGRKMVSLMCSYFHLCNSSKYYMTYFHQTFIQDLKTTFIQFWLDCFYIRKDLEVIFMINPISKMDILSTLDKPRQVKANVGDMYNVSVYCWSPNVLLSVIWEFFCLKKICPC